MAMTYEKAKRIKFIRSTSFIPTKNNYRGRQINTAVCTVCMQELWTEGDPDGVTGVGELNRKVGRHRHEHTMYDKPPHAPRQP